ncbi:MAG: CarD family transcriptional regulator [Amphiplicatus sp.]
MATKTAEKTQGKAKSKDAKSAPARRAKPARKATAPAAKPKASAKPKKTAAKPAAQKPAASKPAAKKAASAKSLAKKSTAATKAPSGAAAKTAPKAPAPKKKAPPAAKPTAKKAGSAGKKKPAADKPASKTVGAAKKKAETAPKPSKKKPLVGQKPRSERSSASGDFIIPLHVQKASQSVNETPVKASPASAEAKHDFKVNDHIVYPAHGVGRIVGIERQLIAGVTNELFLIDFEQEKMKLRVPTAKAKAVGMRALSEATLVKKAIETLKGRARVKRTMWSRRAQEYEAKINSGDIISVAEVVRDLYRASDQPEQSYSERQLFEAALDRLAREVAAVNKSDMTAAVALLEAALQQKKAA